MHVHRADGNRRRRVTGGCNAGIARLAGLLVHTVVAGGRHDNDSGAHRVLHCTYQRIGVRRFIDGMAKGEVDDVDLELLSVFHGELESAQHGARVASAATIEHLQADDARFRGESSVEGDLVAMRFAVVELLNLDFGLLSFTRDQRRDVRAVTVVVIGMASASVCREIKEPIGTAAGEIFALFKTGIDDRDPDLVSVVAGLRETERCDEHVLESSGLLGLLLHAASLDHGVHRNRCDIRIGFERQEVGAMHRRRHRIEAGVSCFDPIAMLAETIRNRRCAARARTDDNALRRRVSAGHHLPQHAIELGWFACRSARLCVVDSGIGKGGDERCDRQRSTRHKPLHSSSCGSQCISPRRIRSTNCSV